MDQIQAVPQPMHVVFSDINEVVAHAYSMILNELVTRDRQLNDVKAQLNECLMSKTNTVATMPDLSDDYGRALVRQNNDLQARNTELHERHIKDNHDIKDLNLRFEQAGIEIARLNTLLKRCQEDKAELMRINQIQADKLKTPPAPAEPIPMPVVGSMNSTDYQVRVAQWIKTAFDERILNHVLERGARFLEEAVELAQSCGIPEDTARAIVADVYGAHKKGEPDQELGGVALTLAGLAHTLKLDIGAAGETELMCCWRDIEIIKGKHKAKPVRVRPESWGVKPTITWTKLEGPLPTAAPTQTISTVIEKAAQ